MTLLTNCSLYCMKSWDQTLEKNWASGNESSFPFNPVLNVLMQEEEESEHSPVPARVINKSWVDELIYRLSFSLNTLVPSHSLFLTLSQSFRHSVITLSSWIHTYITTLTQGEGLCRAALCRVAPRDWGAKRDGKRSKALSTAQEGRRSMGGGWTDDVTEASGTYNEWL